MPPQGLAVRISGLENLNALAGRVGLLGNGAVTRELYENLGAAMLRWVDVNFRTGGSLVGGWKPLRPLTVFGRLQGSNVPLNNKPGPGGLRTSFTYKAANDSVIVGTAARIAEYHQFGTAPYIIRPKKPGGVLAFPAPPLARIGTGPSSVARVGGGVYLRRKPYGKPEVGIISAKRLKTLGYKAPSGKGSVQSFAVVKVVHHPGLPARPMLPRSAADVREDISKTVRDFVRRVLKMDAQET